MKISRTHKLFALCLALVPYGAVHADEAHQHEMAEDDARASFTRGADAAEASETMTEATNAYSALIKDGTVPPSVLQNARCVAIFPNVVTAALGAGGTHGDGVAFCKSADGWSNPAFLDITGGSIGLQAGVKSTDVVLYLTGDDAKEYLSREKITLGGDVSVVAGSFDKSFVAPPEGIVAYRETKGVFAGAALTGMNLSHDESEQRAFYGSYDRERLFEAEAPDRVMSSIDALKKMLPKA